MTSWAASSQILLVLILIGALVLAANLVRLITRHRWPPVRMAGIALGAVMLLASWPGNLAALLANANSCASIECGTPMAASLSVVLWTLALGVLCVVISLFPGVRGRTRIEANA